MKIDKLMFVLYGLLFVIIMAIVIATLSVSHQPSVEKAGKVAMTVTKSDAFVTNNQVEVRLSLSLDLSRLANVPTNGTMSVR